ncbi:DUF4091 domain-containing protein [Niameybacter massiliensis]|uniref:DUF4091 domain-containing protein n=1 Tax=Holtiella tumoricola TaxID=3018743 RepID=A0AA42IYF8_9FIRM|nr:DUF4091 domain-containing protein [Holtiella tumoricola]MDA3729950.1 DUF4091 domain-containing protein [Holtiella tumoricola]
MLSTILLSSLEKVLPQEQPISTLVSQPSIFKNETFNFQVAYQSTDHAWLWRGPVTVSIDSPLKEYISVTSVGLVPSNYPCPPGSDEEYFTTMPCLLPDVLEPLDNDCIKIIPNHWKSLWIEVASTNTLPAGTHSITIIFQDASGAEVARETLNLEIIDGLLPKQTLLHTEWFHTDCIANFYNIDVFSERYWELVEAYMQTAATHGINMILTPLFTPPLDTEIGGERLTVQLVDVTVNNDTYSFNFDKLGRWIEAAKRVGIEYFEMSHLFTQWGAFAIPKIMANVNGELTQIFGWNTLAKDPAYKTFLDTFLPQLLQYLESYGLKDKCYFHISDEPSLEHLESYKFALSLVEKHLEGYPIIDALSNLEFYQTGALKLPIPANDHIHPFIEAGVPNLWTYYCCAQTNQVSNRFMALPSFRNRIIGLQLFKYDIVGFLHWGYNFYNTQYSKKAIDPYKITDAGSAFASGDSFLVYPGEDGTICSIRIKVFAEALYDLRAMQLLASLTSKEHVLELMEGTLDAPITFSSYPHDANYLLNFRDTINKEIKKYL